MLQFVKKLPRLRAKTITPCIPMSHGIQLFPKFLMFRGFNNAFILKLSHWLSFALNKISIEKWVK